MGLGEAILAVGAGARPASFEQFAAAIDPQWIDDALAATGTASVRRRKLPAERVVWLVLGMALFEDRSIAEVVHHLDLVLPAPGGGRGRISNAAIVQARDQLSAAPLAALFAQTATAWAPPAADEARWRGLAVYALDGTTLRVPDTPDNVAAFGRPPSRYGEGAGYPQLRLVALLAVRHHLLAGAAFGPYRTSEGELATAVWEKIPDHAVVTLDRGFASYALTGEPGTMRQWNKAVPDCPAEYNTVGGDGNGFPANVPGKWFPSVGAVVITRAGHYPAALPARRTASQAGRAAAS